MLAHPERPGFLPYTGGIVLRTHLLAARSRRYMKGIGSSGSACASFARLLSRGFVRWDLFKPERPRRRGLLALQQMGLRVAR